jgi:Zn-dependent protease
MPRQNIPLGKILGIPIGLDYSWFLIFVLMTWSLSTTYYPAQFHGWPPFRYWILGGLTSVLFFSSILLHELGHSVVALRYKIPVRSITLFIFGGVAQIADEPPSALSEFLIAIAGPLVSLSLGATFFGLEHLFSGFDPVLGLCRYLSFINFAIVGFNLIPGYPLDGGRVFRAVVWAITKNLRRSTIIASTAGQFFGFGFIFIGIWMMLHGNFGGGLWLSFIGWFLGNAAAAQIQQVTFMGLLGAYKVSQAMSRSCALVPEGLSLRDLVEDQILAKGQRCFIVGEETAPRGLVTLHQIREVGQPAWEKTTVRQTMIPIDNLRSVHPDDPLWSAFRLMDREGVNQLPVIRNGQVVGILTREDVITFLGTLKELGT